MLSYVNTFYDDLFQYHYQKHLGKDQDPEVVPLIVTSFCQAAYLLTLFVVVYFSMDLERWIDKSWVATSIMPLFVILALIHVYRFIWKKRAERVLRRNKILAIRFRLYSNLYIFRSLWLPLLLIFLFNEVF